MIENLFIYQKTFESFKYVHNTVGKYPKSEKFTLAASIIQNYYNVLKYIIKANRERIKTQTFFELDTELKILQLNIRLSFEFKYINFNQYELISKQLSEIGRLLGGWIKKNG